MKTSDVFQAGTIIALLGAVWYGGSWVGAIEVKAESALLAAGKVSTIQIDQATIRGDQKVIRERVRNLNEKLDEQARQSKERAKRTDEKLDAVLQEIRRR